MSDLVGMKQVSVEAKAKWRGLLSDQLCFYPYPDHCSLDYLGGVQPELYAPLAHVVPFGPVATPLPFFVLLLPPPVVWVVVTPFEFLFAVAPLPVFGL
jgi:hypothetical protein